LRIAGTRTPDKTGSLPQGRKHMATTGQIKRLVRDRGFGFIRPEGASEDIFFHSSAVTGTMFDELSEGQNVEFDKENDPRDSRRSRAVNIRVVA
jgi:CspA family cold shock protein